MTGYRASYSNINGPEVVVYLTVTNTGEKTVSAYQLRLSLQATDTLGRTYTFSGLTDCTPDSLQGGLRAGYEVYGHYDSTRYSDIGTSCVIGTWTMNPYIANEAGLYNAVNHGGTMTAAITVTRVGFSDGTGYGTAETGTSY